MFWIFALLLSLIALAFVVYPFARQLSSENEPDRNLENLKAFKEQMAELEQGKRSGDINEEEFAQIEAELKVRLLQDAKDSEEKVKLKQGQSKPIVFISISFILAIVFAGAFYSKNSSLDALELREASQNQFESAEAQQEYIDKLAIYLEGRKEDVEGWFYLGRSYLNTGKLEEAIDAFETALITLEAEPNSTNADKAALMANIAQARFFLNDSSLDFEASRLINQALKFDPQNALALGVSGIAAFESQDFAFAIVQWRKLVALVDREEAMSILSAIQSAEDNLLASGGVLPEQASSASSVDASGSRILVTIDLSEALKAQAAQAESLFVYARAAGGSPMPLAVKRLGISDFPIEVLLDESSAMGPMAGLKQGMEVEVLARLSMAGVANAQSGDIEGISSTFTVEEGAQKVTVIINTVRD